LSRSRSPSLGLLLAFTLLIVGLPFVVTPTGIQKTPVISLDICHPAQTVAGGSIQCSMPLPSITPFQPTLSSFDAHWPPVALAQAKSSDPPEDPPPKAPSSVVA
jgi:hypothetical protein